MSNKKDSEKDSASDEVTLDEKLLNEFATKLEKTINKICEKHPNQDPRLELLVTLGLFAAQISAEVGYSREEYLDLMEDMYEDFDEGDKLTTPPVDKENKYGLN